MLLSKIKTVLKRKSKYSSELEYRLKNGMHIGENCNLYSVDTIDGGWPWLISMGNNVTISTNVTILAHDASTNIVGCGTKLGRVEIGNNVFVGTGATILCNTKIGDNVVIGAGAVVCCDLESNGVYVGIPAKKVCSIEQYRKKYEKLRVIRPDFSKTRAWNDWNNSTEEEKNKMLNELSDGVGFV